MRQQHPQTKYKNMDDFELLDPFEYVSQSDIVHPLNDDEFVESTDGDVNYPCWLDEDEDERDFR